MEVFVSDLGGIGDSHIISVRHGQTRRQAPASALKDRSLKFPALQGGAEQVLKVDVFAPIAGHRLALHQDKPKYSLTLEGSDGSAMRMRLGVRHHTGGAAGERQEPSPSPPEDSGRTQDSAALARQYLEKHSLLQYFQNLLQVVVQARPDDPYRFLWNQLGSFLVCEEEDNKAARRDGVDSEVGTAGEAEVAKRMSDARGRREASGQDAIAGALRADQEAVKCSMGGRRKPPNQKAAKRPQAKREVNFGNYDAGKWVFSNTEYDGSYGIIGGTPVVHEKTGPIQEGLDLLKQEPQMYSALWYKTCMMGWPADQQQYSLCERRKQTVVVTESKGAPFTYVEGNYHALPDCQVQPDQFTDNMMYAGAPCTAGKQPGRGHGCADVPSLSVIRDVDPNDVMQGSVGDCWLLSAMSALAEFSGAIKKVFERTPGIESMPGEGENRYVVTLYDLKTWERVNIEVDERLPGNPNGAGLLGCGPSASGDLWAPYIEKACAIHCGGWDKINGGRCTHAWRMLTGCKEQYTFMPDANGMYDCFGVMNPHTGEWEELANSPHDGFQRLWHNPWPAVGGGGGLQHKITPDEMFERMCAFDDANYIMGAGTKSGSDTDDTDGIVDGHAYTIIDCVDNAGGTVFDLIKMRNPWGQGEFRSGMWDDDGPGWTQYPQVKEALKPVAADDGVFWVEKHEFFRYFRTIYVCATDMAAFVEAPLSAAAAAPAPASTPAAPAPAPKEGVVKKGGSKKKT